MSNFDILIGVDLSHAKKQISDMLKEIGNGYPIKLQAVMDDKSIKMKFADLAKMKGNLEKFKINVDTKGAGDLGKALKQAVTGASNEAKKFVDEVDEGLTKLKTVIKQTKGAKTTTYGNADKTQKVIVAEQAGKKPDVTVELNHEKKITDEIKRQAEAEKVQNAMKKEGIKLEEKVNDIQQRGVAHFAKIKSLQKDITTLNSGQVTDLNKQLQLVEKIQNKYKDLVKNEKDRTFTKYKKDQASAIESKVSKNIDPNIVSQAELQKLKNTIAEIRAKDVEKTETTPGKKTTDATVETAIKNAVKAYDALLEKQKQYIANQKSLESISIKQTNNTDKLKTIDSKGYVPQSMVDNAKALNNNLHAGSSKAEIDEVNREINKMIKLQEDVKSGYKEQAKVAQLVVQAEQDMIKATDKYKGKLEEIAHNSGKQVSDENRKIDILHSIANIENTINDHKKRGTKLSYEEHVAIQNQIKDVTRLTQSHRDLEAGLNREKTLAQQIKGQFESTSYRATRGFDKNPKELRSILEQITQIENRVKNIGNLTGKAFQNEYQSIQQSMSNLNTASRNARDQIRLDNNTLLGRFGKAMQSVPIWTSAMGLFYGAIAQVKQGFESLLEVDKAMVNLAKVTEATTSQLEAFEKQAHSIGNELGVMASDVINATGEFQKLGYSLQQATALGQNSILYANVGDMGIENATKSIVSAVKGFGIEVDKSGNNVTNIVDIFNEVGNNFSVTSEGIGEALRRSSAVLHEAGNSIEQSVALVASANATIQDPARVGTALKTISMRIRGVSEDGEDLGSLVPDLEKTFNKIGEGLSIMDDSDPTKFKSTYDILGQLAGKWEDLSDLERANLVELLGGKNQGVVVSAMLNNWTDATGAYESALGSAGSAQREFNVYMEGYQYKIGQLKVAIEGFWTTLADDDALKGAIDLLTGLVHVMTKLTEVFGGVQISAGFLAVLSLMGSKGLRNSVLGLGKTVAGAGATAGAVGAGASAVGAVGWKRGASASKGAVDGVSEVSKASKGATSAIGGLGTMFMNFGKTVLTVLPKLLKFLGIVGLIAGGVQVLYKLFTYQDTQRKNRIKLLNDEVMMYETLMDKYSENNVSEYVGLSVKKSSGSDLNTEELDRYRTLQDQIKENMPELISRYDEHGEAVLLDAKAIRELITAKEKLYNESKKEAFKLELEDAGEENKFKDLQKYVDNAKKKMIQQSSATSTGESFGIAKEFIENDMKDFEGADEQYETLLKQLRAKVAKKMGENNPNQMIVDSQIDAIMPNLQAGDFDGAIAVMDKNINLFKMSASKMSKEYADSKVAITSHISEFSDMLGKAFDIELTDKNISKDSDEFVFISKLKEQLLLDIDNLTDDDVIEMIENVKPTIEEALNSVQDSGVSISKILEVDGSMNEEDIVKKFDKVIKNIDKQSDSGRQLITVLKALKAEQLATAESMKSQPIDPFGTFKDEVIPLMTDFTNGITLLDSSYRQLADGQELSITQVMELVEKYPELTKSIESHNGTLRLTKEAIMEVAKANEVTFKDSLKMKKDEAKIAVAKAEAIVGAILSEAQATQLLMDVKQKGFDATIENYRAEARIAGSAGGRNLEMGGEDFGGGAVGRDAHNVTEAIIDEALANRKAIESYEDSLNSLKAIQKLLDTDFSSNLGNITSAPEKEKADETKKELQDAKYVVDKYTESIDKLNNSIAEQQKLREKFTEFSKKYRNTLREEIKLNKEKKEAIEAETKSLEKQIKNRNIKQYGVVDTGKITVTDTTSTTTGKGTYKGKYSSFINTASAKYNVDANLIAAIIEQESKWNPKAGSSAGAQGLMQLMPATARGLGVSNTYDPEQNIMGGTKYIAQQLKAFGGNLQKALYAYNAGSGNVSKILASGSGYWKEPKNYYNKVSGYYDDYTAQYGTGKSTITSTTTKSSKDDSKTAGAIEADIESQVREARKRLEELKLEAVEVDAVIANLTSEILKSSVASYEHDRELLQSNITYEEYAMSLYDKSSQKYRNYSKMKLKDLKAIENSHKKEIAFLEKELKTNKLLTSAQKEEINAMLRASKEALYSANSATLELQAEINETKFDILMKYYDKELTAYEKKVKALRDKLKYDIDSERDITKDVEKEKAVIAKDENNIKNIKTNISDDKAFLSAEQRSIKNIDATKKKVAQLQTELKNANKASKASVQARLNEYNEILKKQQAQAKAVAKTQKVADQYEKQLALAQKKLKTDNSNVKKIKEEIAEQKKLLKLQKTKKGKDSVQKKINKLESNLNVANKKVTVDNSNIKAIKAKLDAENKLINNQKANYNATERNATKAKIADLNVDLKGSEKKVNADKKNVDSIKKQITAQEKLLKKQKSNGSSAKTIKKTQDAIKALEKSLTKANAKYNTDNSALKKIKAQITEQKKLLKLQESKYDAKAVETATKKKVALTKDLTSAEKKVTKDTSAVKKIKDQIAEQKKLLKLQKTKKGKETVQSAITKLEKELKTANKKLADDNSAVKKLKAQINEQKNLIATQEAKKLDTKTIDATKATIAKLEKDLANANKKLATDNKTLQNTYYSKYGELQILKEILSVNKGEVLDIEKQIKGLKKKQELYKSDNELYEKIGTQIAEKEAELETAKDTVKDMYQEIENAYESMGDKFVEAYKEQMNLMKTAEDKKYDETMKKEEKAHTKKMENLNDELEALRKIYEQKLDNIDRDESTDTFDKDIKKLQKESNEVNVELSKLSMDDSYEAKAKKTELTKKLAEIEEQIVARQHERELELRKQSLSDEQEIEEEKLQNKVDTSQEEYDNYVENQEKIKEERDKYWEEQMNDERKFAELRELAIKGDFATLLSMTKTWSTDVTSNMESLGKNITLNFTDKLTEAIEQFEYLKSIDMGSLEKTLEVPSTNINAPTDKTNEKKDSGSVIEDKKTDKKTDKTTDKDKKTETPTKPTDTKKDEKRYHTVKKGDTLWDLAVKYYKSGSKYSKIQTANPKVNPKDLKVGTKLLIPFRSGGYTGDWSGDGGKVALLHKKELVLNQGQTKDILDSAKIIERIKNALPKLNLPSNLTVPETNAVQPNVTTTYEVNVNVENMNGDKKSADIVGDQILQKMKRTKGGRI